jgi:hypothetical protein
MQQVYTLSAAAYREASGAFAAAADAQRLRDGIAKAKASASGDVAAALDTLDKKIEAVVGVRGAGGGRGGRGGGGVPGGSAAAPSTLNSVAVDLSGAMNVLQGADVQATDVQVKSITAARTAVSSSMAKWTAIKTVDLPAMNAKLKAAGMTLLTIE